MELVKHIRNWYNGVPEQNKRYLTQQMSYKYPGLPNLSLRIDIDAMPLIFDKMETDAYTSVIGHVTAFIGCIDYLLYRYADTELFCKHIEEDRDMEALLIFHQSYDSAKHVEERIDNADTELENRQKTVASWEQLKNQYLNHEYLHEYNLFLLQENTKKMAKSIALDITKKFL